MKIGITERGDPSLDFSWVEKAAEMDGIILITKNLTDKVIRNVLPFIDKTIFHISCTGFGGTIVEPNIPEYTDQLEQAFKLKHWGVPIERIVIRVDPIIPTAVGLKRAVNVIEKASEIGFKRFRISLVDCYPHVRERFLKANLKLPYGNSFVPDEMSINRTNKALKELKEKYPDIVFESCSEGVLTEAESIGCVSVRDFNLLGLDTSKIDDAGYQRKGCLCCSAKTELLTEKKQCPYKCLYCYWK